VLNVSSAGRVEIDVIELEPASEGKRNCKLEQYARAEKDSPVLPEESAPIAALTRSDVSDYTCHRGGLSSRHIKVCDREKTGRRQEPINPIE